MGIKLAIVLGFIVAERLFALRPAKVFRVGWRTDLAFALFGHLLTLAGLVVTVGLTYALLSRLPLETVHAAVASQPAALQFVEALLITDLCAYWVHRLAHAWPPLWRFHRVHHSSEHLDWLASARVHPVDLIVVRTAQFAPLFVLGFSKATFGIYGAFIGLWALVLHANIRVRLPLVEHVFATTRFHHWHHALDRRCNFAGQLPLLDRWFGTLHLPSDGSWPAAYGADGAVAAGFLAQVALREREDLRVGAHPTRVVPAD